MRRIESPPFWSAPLQNESLPDRRALGATAARYRSPPIDLAAPAQSTLGARATRERGGGTVPTYPILGARARSCAGVPRLRRTSTPYSEVITGDSVNMKSKKANQRFLPFQDSPFPC